MKKLAIITATRAEYGLYKPLIAKLREVESDHLKVELTVTGTHLSPAYGMTVDNIIKDGVRIDHRIEIPVASGSPEDISANQAVALKEFTKLFCEVRYDAVYILGDRYEMLMVAIAALNTATPVFHIYGGDTTEGAIDEAIRHSISKMSYLHFTTNEDSRRRVIQLGESPDRVFVVGSLGIDNILNMELEPVEDVLSDLGLKKDGPVTYAMCTYHPVTLKDGDVEEDLSGLLNAIKERPDIEFIVTKSNSDLGGAKINEILDRESVSMPNMHVFTSLGAMRYLTLMSGSHFVIGNSSSGLYEAPSFHIPTINIGERQRGRLQADSVINCTSDKMDILRAIEKAMSPEFIEICRNTVSPFGDGHAAEKIREISLKAISEPIDLKKSFYNIPTAHFEG